MGQTPHADNASPGTGEAETAPPPAARGPRRPAARVVRHGLRGVWLLVLAPLVFVLLLPVLMIGQEITAPSWITRRVEDQAAQVLGGGSLGFGEITVEVGRDLHPIIRIRNATLRDAQDQLLARVPQIEARLSPRGLVLRREVLPQHIILTGAEIALRRDATGRVAIAFDGGGRQVGEAETLGALVESFDSVFDLPALQALETLRIAALVINYQDDRAGRAWIVDGGRLTLSINDAATRMTADLAVLAGRAYATTLSLTYESDRTSPRAQLRMTLSDVAAADIATQSPGLAWLGLLDARLSAQLDAGTGADGRLAPLRARLESGAGALRPDPTASPVGFDHFAADLSYDPAAARISFERLDVESDVGAVTAQGQAYLRDMQGGLPQSLLAQFEIADLTTRAGPWLPVPVQITGAYADFRLRMSPFAIEIGQFGLRDGPDPQASRMTGTGHLSAGPEGWDVALDAGIDHLSEQRLLDIWPPAFRAGDRRWFAANFTQGAYENLRAGLRITAGQPPVWALSGGFHDAVLRPVGEMPPLTDLDGTLSIAGNGLVLTADRATMTLPGGDAIAIDGSVFTIPDMTLFEAPALVHLRTASTLAAALALLDHAPFHYLSNADLPVALATGTAEVTGTLGLPLANVIPPEAIDFGFAADLRDVRSEVLVPGRSFAADQLHLEVTKTDLSISGPVRIGAATGEGTWHQPLGPGAGAASTVDARVRLDDGFFQEFNIALPPGMVRGSAAGQLSLTLPHNGSPAFRLTTDLRGIALALPGLGWSKAADAAGRLEMSGSLGPVPQIDRIEISAPGFSAQGRIAFGPGGVLDRVSFDQVTLGDWLSAPVDLIHQGDGRPLAVRITGGSLDLRRASFGPREPAGPGGGDVGPISATLDRLDVTEGIGVTDFTGTFDTAGGFNGRFSGLLNGRARIEGVVAPIGNGVGVRVMSDDAGAALAAAGLLQTASGGALDLTLMPIGSNGAYDGTATMTNLRVVQAPALARLLDAVSVVGLLQQLGGQGLLFTNVDLTFRLGPDRITLAQASAVGPGLGISADGYYEQAAGRLDMQGVISPVYLLNGIGAFLTRPGEGLFGFNYTVTGPVSDPQVSVNPLSVLTPGMFREIFRRPVPQLE